MKFKLDPDAAKSFQTYIADFPTSIGGKTEIWVSKGTESFGIVQGSEDDVDLIILRRDELLKLQILVDQAVEMLEDKID